MELGAEASWCPCIGQSKFVSKARYAIKFVWPVALLMAGLYPEERRYWMRVFCVSLALTVIVLVSLGIREGFLGKVIVRISE